MGNQPAAEEGGMLRGLLAAVGEHAGGDELAESKVFQQAVKYGQGAQAGGQSQRREGMEDAGHCSDWDAGVGTWKVK